MESATPAWALAAAYWLHMLATVVWVGGLAALSWLVLPAARAGRGLADAAYSEFLGRLFQRLQWVGWFSLAILTGTGMFQMSANVNYQGVLAIENSWALAILIKHFAIGVMVLASAYATWGIGPQLQRLAFLQSAGGTVDAARLDQLRLQEQRLMQVNFALSLIVLALTAWARVS